MTMDENKCSTCAQITLLFPRVFSFDGLDEQGKDIESSELQALNN
jgi:hypothetical protein